MVGGGREYVTWRVPLPGRIHPSSYILSDADPPPTEGALDDAKISFLVATAQRMQREGKMIQDIRDLRCQVNTGIFVGDIQTIDVSGTVYWRPYEQKRRRNFVW